MGVTGLSPSDAKQLGAKLRAWRADPVMFVRENFSVEPDIWQKDALMAAADPKKSRRYVCMSACAGPGKSAVLAWLGWWFLACFGEVGQHPKGFAISITEDNLKSTLWPEFAKWMDGSVYLKEFFIWSKERIFCKAHPNTWFLEARSFKRTANPEEMGRALSGLHSKFPFVLIDESGDIHPAVARSAEQALSTCSIGMIAQAGNPTSHEGVLYESVNRQGDKWTVIQITGDPEDPKRSSRIDIEWARKEIEKHGRDNPWVMAYILGRFPPNSMNTLLGPEEVALAMRRIYKPADYAMAQKRIGVDVARFGDDATMICPRQGVQAYKMVEMRKQDGFEVAQRVIAAKVRWESEMEFVDGTGGYGASVIDNMVRSGYSPLEINFAGSPGDPRFLNKRAEMWWLMADWVKKRGSLPQDSVLAKELTAPLYFSRNGKFQMEEKDQIKKRLGFSPDRADALALTFALPEMVTAVNPFTGLPNPGAGGGKANSEWDPYAGVR